MNEEFDNSKKLYCKNCLLMSGFKQEQSEKLTIVLFALSNSDKNKSISNISDSLFKNFNTISEVEKVTIDSIIETVSK